MITICAHSQSDAFFISNILMLNIRYKYWSRHFQKDLHFFLFDNRKKTYLDRNSRHSFLCWGKMLEVKKEILKRWSERRASIALLSTERWKLQSKGLVINYPCCTQMSLPGMEDLQLQCGKHASAPTATLLVGCNHKKWNHFRIAQSVCRTQEVVLRSHY